MLSTDQDITCHNIFYLLEGLVCKADRFLSQNKCYNLFITCHLHPLLKLGSSILNSLPRQEAATLDRWLLWSEYQRRISDGYVVLLSTEFSMGMDFLFCYRLSGEVLKFGNLPSLTSGSF